jgi:signal transduction histidine kinase
MNCYLFTEPIYLIFSPDSLPELLYYSHLSSALIAILVGLFIFLNGRRFLLNKLLFLITATFFLWVFSNLITWTNVDSGFILAAWTSFEILSALLSILCIYFSYVFLFKEDVSFKLKIIFLILLSPVLIFAPTYLNLTGFNLTDCDAFGFEEMPFKLYYTFLGILAMVWIFVLLIKSYFLAKPEFRKQILLMGIGIESFLFFFFITIFLTSYLTSIEILDDSRLEMYGLFGMMVFMAMIGVLMVKFNTFNVKLIATQALIVSITLLVGSQLLFIESTTGFLVTGATFLFSAIAGYLLTKSVKKEIQHREEIEKLVGKLKKANNRLRELDKEKSEFVSIASHQLRSPLTAIGGYVSLLRDGSFGKMPEKACEPLERIYTSTQNMSLSIEEYLNVSRIESGNMKYNKVDFNLSEQAEHICDDLRSVALKKGLLLFFRTNLQSYPIVHADQGKLVQSVHNLVNNSIKYTEKGTVTVYVHDDKINKKIFLEVIDTGIGMNEKALENLFQKFERADNAHKTNIQGTGLGLYMALKIVEAMGGTITAYSEGEGKGSRFVLELPLVV